MLCISYDFNNEEKTVTQLILATIFFITLHVGVAGTLVRDRAIEKMGEKAYRGAFSLFSLLGIFWLAHAYKVADYIETWGQLAWFKPIAAPLMLVAFLLVVLGVTTPNPTAVGGEKLLMTDAPVQGIQRVTRHPFLWGIVVWAVTHFIVNGDMASLVFFGSFAILALLGMRSIDVKRKKACGQQWERYAGTTSIIPFLAIKEGRNMLVIAEFKGWRLVLALVFYAAMMHFHKALFGVSPLF
jgi:uncharacterized membrane protein